jgi:hypothetical protein
MRHWRMRPLGRQGSWEGVGWGGVGWGGVGWGGVGWGGVGCMCVCVPAQWQERWRKTRTRRKGREEASGCDGRKGNTASWQLLSPHYPSASALAAVHCPVHLVLKMAFHSVPCTCGCRVGCDMRGRGVRSSGKAVVMTNVGCMGSIHACTCRW